MSEDLRVARIWPKPFLSRRCSVMISVPFKLDRYITKYESLSLIRTAHPHNTNMARSSWEYVDLLSLSCLALFFYVHAIIENLTKSSTFVILIKLLFYIASLITTAQNPGNAGHLQFPVIPSNDHPKKIQPPAILIIKKNPAAAELLGFQKGDRIYIYIYIYAPEEEHIHSATE